MDKWITIARLIQVYEVEPAFIEELIECNLLTVEKNEDQVYLLTEQLATFERFVHLRYDLDINVPGLEVIDRLLSKIHDLRSEINYLKQFEQKL